MAAPASGGVFGHLTPKAKPANPLTLPQQTMTWEKFARTVLPDAISIEAQVPASPVTSIRGLVNLGGLVLGLVLGLGASALLELRDKSFHSDADVMTALELPVLAVVPRVVDAVDAAKARNRQLLYSAVGVVCLVGAGYLTWTLKLWKSVI